MKLYLDEALAVHRRGRFLAGLLGARPSAMTGQELPTSGLLLTTGKALQGTSDVRRGALRDWTARPGRTLLLLPPFAVGPVCAGLDWQIAYSEAKPLASGFQMPDLLREEILYLILGRNGACKREAGHCWGDGSAHTRYLKAHSGSGLLAVTCLPLWSISLLNQAGLTLAWLDALHTHSGLPESIPPLAPGSKVPGPDPEALGLLVCLYGFDCADVEGVMRRLEASPLPVMRLQPARLPGLIGQLQAAGYLDEGGITPAGNQALAGSPFWGFAQRLREEQT